MNPVQYLREVREELGKVVWPSNSQTRRYALAVLVVVAVATLYVFGLDSLFGILSGWLYQD